jgi:hypothetical protein
MLTLCVLGAAFLAGLAVAATADPLCRTPTGPCRPPGFKSPLCPPPIWRRSKNSVPLPQTKNYQMPSDFDANANLHPYISGLGPCPHEPCHSTRGEASSHYNR